VWRPVQEKAMTELLTVKVRLPTERVDQGAYTIESVDSADEGRYFCRATNPLGTAEASVQVNMLGTSDLGFFFKFSSLP